MRTGRPVLIVCPAMPSLASNRVPMRSSAVGADRGMEDQFFAIGIVKNDASAGGMEHSSGVLGDPLKNLIHI